MKEEQQRQESNLIGHGPCPAPTCGSSDAFATYDDGHGYCFSCKHVQSSTASTQHGQKGPVDTPSSNMISGEVFPLAKRHINAETCAKWGYKVGEMNGRKVQIANYIRDNSVVAQKVRFADKSFVFLGNPKLAGLYGQHLWRDGGKMVVVTEGEIDALTVSQLQGNKWPVVSVPNGAAGAAKALKKELEWLEKFDRVILMFDNDEAGATAVAECAPLFTPGKCAVARLPLKDANEMLQAGRGHEVIAAMWDAKPYCPDGIVSIADLREELNKPVELGLPWPWPSLTAATYGIRPDELYALGAGTGLGKSEIWKEVMIDLATQHGQTVGGIFLEEAPAHTARCLASKIASKRFHVPGAGWTQAEFDSTISQLEKLPVYLYNHFGYTDYEVVKARIRYMVVSLGCKHIFLDHVTALVSGDVEGDERKQLAFIMTDLASLVRELHITLYFISHLNTPDGTPHEEGGRVMIRHFFGSRALGQWSSYMFALERDQQEEDENKRHVSTFRILKDRYTGEGTGKTFYLRYDKDTGRLTECDNPNNDDAFPSTTGGKDEF